MKTFQYSALCLENLKLVEQDIPLPGEHEVLVKFHAASLNYRDIMFADGIYNPKPNLPAVPLSDGAGEVIGTGTGVTQWKIGDRVTPIFMQGWLDGHCDAQKASTALGAGELDGVLREYGTFHQDGLISIPEHLSYQEAATLPCAAVTAWHALVANGGIKAGDTVLTLGTGGVSIFAIQIAKLFGTRVIATSSSDEKLERVRALGADETINYRTTPDWDKEVLKLTGRLGVDQVVEVGGAGTLPRSINATRISGLISLIGVLTGSGTLDPIKLLMKSIRLQGTFVGSKEMFEAMNAKIVAHQLHPVIDRTYAFDEAPAAIAAMKEGNHFGKIVIGY
jgi:NADPH:quinone reductase-like Zn-dependent oxidoreductase